MDAGNLLILSNLQKPWTIACKDISRVLKLNILLLLYFTTYYSFNKIILDVITEKFDIQVDENTKTQAALLHDDIPGYDLPTLDFVQTSINDDEDISILEEDNLQIYAYLKNVLVHMIDNQQIAIFKSNQDFNKNKEKILQYIKYAEIGKLHQSCVLIR